MEENGGGNVSDGEKGSDKADDSNLDFEMEHNDNAKRLKTDCLSDKSNESKESDSNCEASTSTSDSSFHRYKGRNYRKFLEDESSNNESAKDEEAAEDLPQDSLTPNTRELDETIESDNHSIFSETTSPCDTVIPDSDSEADDDHPVLKKAKPKHNWFIVPEIANRQLGTSSKKHCSELFQRRCYGSLHCVQRLELMYKLEKHEGCVNSLNFHPNGNYLASGSDDLKVVLWDWKNGNPLLSYETKHRGNVFQSKFLPLSGDLHIVTCARDGQVRLAQVSALEGLRSLRRLGSHHGPCHKLSLVYDQPQIVISVGEDGLILRHDLRAPKSEKLLYVMNNDTEVALYSVSGHPLNGHEICVSGRDYMARSYDLRRCSGNNTLNTYHPFKKPNTNSTNLHITCAVYNHNGSEILASYNDEDIYLFDVNGPPASFIHHYEGHRNGATIKAVNFFGPKSEFIVSGSDCGNIYFWERDTEAIVQWILADDQGVVNCLEPHPQLPFLCTSGLDWDVKVWVPSYEQEPALTNLAKTVKSNLEARSQWAYSPEIDDTQILWMLWRQLSGADQIRGVNVRLAMENSQPGSSDNNSSSSSNDSSSLSEPDSDSDGPGGCTTS